MIHLFRVSMTPEATDNVAQVLTPKSDGSLYVGEGPKVKEFEDKFHALVGTDEKPLMTNSCTSALIMAMNIVGVKDKIVLTTPINCTAGSLAILNCGGEPVWCDVNPITGLIDPIDVKRKLDQYGNSVAAIMGVDWAGRSCDYNTLKSYGVPVIQDAAHCLHIETDNHGDYVCWSFGGIKHLCTIDGGALLTPANKYEEARLMRWYGLDRESGADFRCAQNIKILGSKYQSTDVNAAIGLANIKQVEERVAAAKSNARYLNIALSSLTQIIVPKYSDKCSYWLYSILVPGEGKRDKFMNFMKEKGIGTSQVHARNDKHDIFWKRVDTNLPGTTYFDSYQVAIPVGFWVTNEDLVYIVDSIKEFFTED